MCSKNAGMPGRPVGSSFTVDAGGTSGIDARL
jgi:hypothetical protein